MTPSAFSSVVTHVAGTWNKPKGQYGATVHYLLENGFSIYSEFDCGENKIR